MTNPDTETETDLNLDALLDQPIQIMDPTSDFYLDDESAAQSANPDLRETPCSFITGPAGSGKSFTLRQRLLDNPSYAVLSATTGIASVNLNCTTIHSLLGFFDEDSLRDAYLKGAPQRKLRRVIADGYSNVVIDEVSMLSASMLDLLVKVFDDVNQQPSQVDIHLRRPPIGLILTGDPAQLPAIPDSRLKHSRARVPTPWFFDASSWPRFARNTLRLTKVWRQADERYLRILNYARAGRGAEAAGLLSAAGVEFHTAVDIEFDGTTLTSKNDEVDRFNQVALDRVKGRLMALPARRWGKLRSEWKNIPDRTILREGAYVMILSNFYVDRDLIYVNGDCGHVRGIQPSGQPGEPPKVLIELARSGTVVPVRSVVRSVDSLDRPSDMHDEITVASGEDLGGYIGQPHFRAKAKRYVSGQLEYFPIRLAYASTVHKCVDSNERVPVFNWGLLKLREVKEGDITPFGVIKAVADSIHPAWTIHTERGYEITCSAEHRWQTNLGLVETQSLEVGNSIQLAQGRPFPGSDEVPTELAWFMGALCGYGSYNDRDDGTLHMASGKDPEVGYRYKSYLNDVEGLRCEWRKGKKTNGLHSTSQPFRRKLLGLGLDYVTGPNKKIPEKVWQSGWQAWGAYLQGLFDTDGHVGRSYLVLTTASEQMSRDVQNMLLGLGIFSKRRRHTGLYKGENRPYWQVSVHAAGLPDFINRVGFSVTRKKDKLEGLRPNRSITRTDGFDQIVSIESSSDQVAMRDVEIASPHIMSFGPFVGHNCQGLSLDKLQIDFRSWAMNQPAMAYTALSRCRTLEGLRIVGSKEVVASKCVADPRVKEWL
jgi:hypothetical protein